MQVTDVLFPILGLTRTGIVNSFLQTAARAIFGFISLPLHIAYYPVVLIVLYCFSLGEGVRYGYNFCTTVGIEETLFGRIMGHLRWNFFLVIYPVGAFGDGLAAVMTIPVVRDSNPMLFSVAMPNFLNISFNFLYFLYLLPFAYAMQFPVNYSYLVGKRAQFYQAANQKKKIS